jgi:enamine deaminase RidA (YjgF/YER057c/UK114 family)
LCKAGSLHVDASTLRRPEHWSRTWASGPDIVLLRVYAVDATREKFQQVQIALDELKGDGMPSITTIGVQSLYSPDILVEIEMVVRVP